jgi:hypothetical protein
MGVVLMNRSIITDPGSKMKTRTLTRTSFGIIASSLIAAAALAGPGPQYWNRPAAMKADTVKKDGPVPAKCDGCKTAPIWVMGDKAPAGKGVGLHVVGKKHECSRCTGAVVTENGRVKSDMKHNTACGPLLCCGAAAKIEPVVRICSDPRLVSVTETKPAWHNGRGPLTTVEVGKKLVCTSCDTPMIVMKPSGHNGRGAMAPVAIKGTHDCGNGCAAVPIAN